MTIDVVEKGKKINVEATADFFIIPNSASRIQDYYSEDTQVRRREEATKICSDNNVDFDESKDYMVQTWITSEDLHADNITDHGFHFEEDGERYWVHAGIGRFIPSNLINIKEGETVTLSFNDNEVYARNDLDEEHPVNVNVILHITAAQTKYRYRNFGKFEDTLKYVCH
jgi:hypothetical protein